MKNKLLLTALTFAGSASLQAAVTFSTNASAPSVNGADIANIGPFTINDFGQGVIWGDRQARGQTFTTLGGPGFELNSLTFQSTGDRGGSSDYRVRVGTLAGSNISDIYEEDTGTVSNGVTAGDYVTWSFSTPISLAGGTQYVIDVVMLTGSGYVLGGTGDNYAGGTAIDTGNGTNANDNGPTITNSYTQDRVFHLDMVAVPVADAIPEPSSVLLGGLGILSLFRRRRG